jgi:hypothetical protein
MDNVDGRASQAGLLERPPHGTAGAVRTVDADHDARRLRRLALLADRRRFGRRGRADDR